MASFSQGCIYCNALIGADASWCPSCQAHHPFGYQCWNCHCAIKKGQTVCALCGNALIIKCPKCAQKTFAQSRCEVCDASLLQRCPNPKCQDWQYFLAEKCHSCGKPLRR